MTGEPETAAVRLAKLAIAYEKALAIFFPRAAFDMAETASEVMAEAEVRYCISLDGRSITCTRCRLTSRNPHDIENLYCGQCHVFHASADPRQ